MDDAEKREVAEKIDKLKNTIAGSLEDLLEIADPNKHYQDFDKELEKADESTADIDEDVYFGTLTQDLTELQISDQFAGIVFFLSTMAKSNVIDPEKAVGWMRQYYEYDTGEMLRVNQIQSLLLNKKTEKYAESIIDNIKKSYERVKSLDLAELSKKFMSESGDDNTPDTPVNTPDTAQS